MINDILTLIYMMAILGTSIIVNTVLGVVIAKRELKFDKNLLKSGLLKSIIVCVSIIAFCFTLELLPCILLRVNILIPTEIITVIELSTIFVTAYTKYSKDIFEKIKLLLDSKESDK